MAEKRKIFTAKSIEEAKAMAVQEFGTEESKISFTVLEEPKKGLRASDGGSTSGSVGRRAGSG